MNHYEPPEETPTKDCEECKDGKEYYSDCCGAELIPNGTTTRWYSCSDCKESCNQESETCQTCKGHGFIEIDLEEEKITHMEQKYERRKDDGY